MSNAGVEIRTVQKNKIQCPGMKKNTHTHTNTYMRVHTYLCVYTNTCRYICTNNSDISK